MLSYPVYNSLEMTERNHLSIYQFAPEADLSPHISLSSPVPVCSSVVDIELASLDLT